MVSGGKPIVVGGGASVVATVVGTADAATADGAGAIVEIGASVEPDVVELAPTMALEPTAAGSKLRRSHTRQLPR